RKVHDPAAHRFGIGDDGWTDVQHQRAHDAGVVENSLHVQVAPREWIAKRGWTEQMHPSVALPDDHCQRFAMLLGDVQPQQPFDPDLQLGENDVLLSIHRLLELRIRMTGDAVTKLWIDRKS